MHIVHVLPTFNESANIGPMLEALRAMAPRFPDDKWSMLVVDDDSPDGTADVVRQMQTRYPEVHLLTGPRRGIGSAVARGLRHAMDELKADIIVTNDADFQWNPDDIPRLLDKIREGADVVVASRHVPGGEVGGFSPFRWLNHFIASQVLATYLAGVNEVHDHSGNFRAFRVHGVLDRIDLGILDPGYPFFLDILGSLSMVTQKFAEVPSAFVPRKLGQSKINPLSRRYISDVSRYFAVAARIRLRRLRHSFSR
jgi:dolichol-phosphate mannosyltransferase